MQVPGQQRGPCGDGGGGGPAAVLAGGAGGGGDLGLPGQLHELAAGLLSRSAGECLQGGCADKEAAQRCVPVDRGGVAAGLQVVLGLGAGAAGLAVAAAQVQGLGGECSPYLGSGPGHAGPGMLAGGGAPGQERGLDGEAGRLRVDSGGRAGGQQAHLWAEPGQAPQQERAAGAACLSERREPW